MCCAHQPRRGVFAATVLAALGGLVLGPTLNLVACRLPRTESRATPGSRCWHCNHPVRRRDLIPVVSWLLLRGRCRDCDEPISRRYPLVEAATGLLFAAVVVAHHKDPAELVLGLALVAFLVPLALIDLDTRLLPNKLTLPAAVVAIVLSIHSAPSCPFV